MKREHVPDSLQVDSWNEARKDRVLKQQYVTGALIPSGVHAYGIDGQNVLPKGKNTQL